MLAEPKIFVLTNKDKEPVYSLWHINKTMHRTDGFALIYHIQNKACFHYLNGISIKKHHKYKDLLLLTNYMRLKYAA